jgi:hypothetical protein
MRPLLASVLGTRRNREMRTLVAHAESTRYATLNCSSVKQP